MTIFIKMAWRNIMRNARRTLITLGAVTFGLSAMIILVALNDGSHTQWVENTVRNTGHVKIFKSGYHEDTDLKKAINDASLIFKELENEASVSAYVSRVEAEGLISTAENSYGVMIMGIDPEEEGRLSAIRERVIKGEYLSGGPKRGVLIGQRLAERLSAAVGDKIVLMVQGADGSLNSELFRLKGIFRMGAVEFDSSVAVISLEDAQAITSLGEGVTEISLFVDSPSHVLPLSERLKGRLLPLGYEVYTWKELMPSLEEMIYLDNAFMYIILLIVLIVASLGILNTILMSIMERIREFGIIMAMGTRPYQVVFLVMSESFFIGLLGIIFGTIIGTGVNSLLGIKGVDLSRWAEGMEFFAIFNPILYPETNPGKVLWACGMVLLVTLSAALYPALKASRFRPVEAMRHV